MTDKRTTDELIKLLRYFHEEFKKRNKVLPNQNYYEVVFDNVKEGINYYAGNLTLDAADRLKELQADNERLRNLIKQVWLTSFAEEGQMWCCMLTESFYSELEQALSTKEE